MNIVMPHNLTNASDLKKLDRSMIESISNTGNVFNGGITRDMIDMSAFRAAAAAAGGGGEKPKRTRRKRRSLK